MAVQLPSVAFHTVAGAKLFVQEERPAEVARPIIPF
jgi:hypothetical protein